MTEPAGGVDPRGEPERDGGGVDGGRVDAGGAHERAEAGSLRSGERPQPGDHERAVLGEERHDVGDGGDRDEVEVTSQSLRLGAEKRLAELEGDAGAAELGEWVLGRARRHDRARGQLVGGPVVVGDDHLEAACARVGDLGRGRDPAVDGHDETAAVVSEPRERLAPDAVALVESAGQVPRDVRAELAERQDGERSRADPVGVVVAVDADPLPGGDAGANRLARRGHVTQGKRVVQGLLAGEERSPLGGVGVPAPDENACRDLADAELLSESRNVPVRARTDRPGALLHRTTTVGSGSDGAGQTAALRPSSAHIRHELAPIHLTASPLSSSSP